MSVRRRLVLFGSPGAGSFNEAAWRAADALAGQGMTLSVHWVGEATPAARAAALQEIVALGSDLVVVHGGQGDAPVRAVAPAFPEVAFALTQGDVVAPNVVSYEVLQEQSAFLAGVLAGLRAGPQGTGHLSGEKVLPGLKGRAAFVDGVRRQQAPRDAVVHTLFCGNQHDAPLAARAGTALAERGARVIFAMLDRGRDGLTEVCRARGLWQIGNVLDWVARDPAVFLASALADSGWCVRQAVLDHQQAALPLGSKVVRGLEDPATVRLLLGAEVTADERAEVETWAQQVVTGAVSPTLVYDGPEVVLPVVAAS